MIAIITFSVVQKEQSSLMSWLWRMWPAMWSTYSLSYIG